MAYRGRGRGGRGGGGDRGDQRPHYGGGGGISGGGGRGSSVWPPLSSPAPAAAPVTIRQATSSASPAPAPRQLAPEPATACSAPSAAAAAALAKEVEKKLFVSDTALAPPAAAASATVAASQGAVASDSEDGTDVDLALVSKKGLAHSAWLGLGTVGKVMIRANYFLVDVADNDLFHYDVAINPESKSRQTNREVLSELIKLHGKTALGGKLPAYDGRKSLYTAGSLPFESEEFVVTLVDPEKKDKERAEREYKITIRIAGRTDLYHLHQFLRGRQRDMPQETIQVLDVVLRESPSWNYVTVSRSFFSTTFGHRGDIGEGLECWRGYYQSLPPTQMGLSLNIDISATSFFKPVTVIKFVEEFLNIRDSSRPLSDSDRVKIKKALCGVRIETSHQQDQIRRYKITGLTPIPMSQLIFPVDDKGTRQTVVQYFWDKYNYRLKYGSWPCLQAGSDSRPVYLPMEVCKIVEGQRYSKKLNDRQVTNILRATCKRPQEREQSIRDMVVHNNYAEDKFAQEFGIKVCSDLVSVPARVLPPPLLKYNDSGREKTCAPSVGQWNMINKKMINGETIDNWTCLNFSRIPPEEVQRFCMDLTHMCNATGMNVNPRPFVEVKSAAPNHIENALRDVHRRATQMAAQQGTGSQLQLLIVILPDVSGSYGKIKRVCETDIGIVSQCCLPKHASRPNKQYLENVALKVHVKVGGRNTVLERAFVRNGIPFVSEVPTIIFGADVTHPPPGEDSAPSIAAVVASMDWPEITKYRGLVSAQPHRQEIIEDLFTVSKDPQKGHNVNGGMIRELLIAFRRKTNRRPERIIFYRDGVSEGQFSHVLLHEMDAIRKACASLEEGYLPPVTFVVVQKRHHTRLFPEVHGRRDMTDKSGNILPGTVVDQKICHPTEFDFYLCSHAGIQETSRPTHYHVLYDENHFTADALQSLTNNLCYTYARCTRAVSVEDSEDAQIRIRFLFNEIGKTEWVRKSTKLGEAVEKAFQAFGLKAEDCFFNSGTKPLCSSTELVRPCTIDVNVGLPGGEYIRISLDDWIRNKMAYPVGFFELIDIPLGYRRSGASVHYVVALSELGRQILVLVLSCLERVHGAGLSFNGQFTLDRVYYIPSLHAVDIFAARTELTPVSYKNDLQQVVRQVIDVYLRYEDEKGDICYPMYIQSLVSRINSIPNAMGCLATPVRRLISCHPATKTSSFRIAVTTSLVIKYERGFADHMGNHKSELVRVLSSAVKGPITATRGLYDWRPSVSDRYAAPGLRSHFYHKLANGQTKNYKNSLIGRLDFSRCVFSNCKEPDFAAEAALYLLWEEQYSEVMEKLVVDYNPKPKPGERVVQPLHIDPDWLAVEDQPNTWERQRFQPVGLPQQQILLGATGFIMWNKIDTKTGFEMIDMYS